MVRVGRAGAPARAAPGRPAELIRPDQEEQARKRVRELIEEGLNSGPGQALTPKCAAQLKKQVLGDPS